MKTCLLSPRLIKLKKDKTNKSSHILDDLSKFETSEFVNPGTTRHKSKKKRKANKSINIFEDSSQLFKTTSPQIKKFLSPKKQLNNENSLKDLEKGKKTRKKSKKKTLNNKKIQEFKHPLPWGADQRIIVRKKTSDNEDTKGRIKTDRDTSRRALRKEIGLDLYQNVRVKSKPGNKSEEKQKAKRSPDPTLLSYMKKKKKNERLAKLRLKIEENLKEKERIKALVNLEKTMNKKMRKKRKKKSKLIGSEEEKIVNNAQMVVSKKEKIRDLFKKKKNQLSESVKEGKKKLDYSQYTKQILTIQRWIRRVLPSLREKQRDSQVYLENFKDCLQNSEFLSMSQTAVPEVNGQETHFFEKTEEEPIKKPKKVEKIPVLCLTSILQSKNSSFDESEKINQYNGIGPNQGKQFDELYEQFENLNIDSLNSFCSEMQEISRLERPSLEFEKNDESQMGKMDEEEKNYTKNTEENFESSEKNEENFEKLQENSLVSFCNIQELDSGSSESSNFIDAENCLKQILEKNLNNTNSAVELFERPGIAMVDHSESSEEEWNAKNVIIYTDTNISEQALETLEYQKRYFLTDYDKELQDLIFEEIESFLVQVKFRLREKEVDSSFGFINEIIDRVFDELEKNGRKFLDLMSSPIMFDPFERLKSLQAAGVGEYHKPQYLKDLIPSYIKPKLQISKCQTKSQKIYIEMLIACINEALNTLLPYGQKGNPDPWSALSPKFPSILNSGQIYINSIKTLSKWSNVKNGKYLQDHFNDDSIIEKIREERLNLILSEYIHEYEPTWLYYEDEETQIKIDISELVFDYLITDTCLCMFT